MIHRLPHPSSLWERSKNKDFVQIDVKGRCYKLSALTILSNTPVNVKMMIRVFMGDEKPVYPGIMMILYLSFDRKYMQMSTPVYQRLTQCLKSFGKYSANRYIAERRFETTIRRRAIKKSLR